MEVAYRYIPLVSACGHLLEEAIGFSRSAVGDPVRVKDTHISPDLWSERLPKATGPEVRIPSHWAEVFSSSCFFLVGMVPWLAACLAG